MITKFKIFEYFSNENNENIKKGVDFIYNQHPELNDIGTKLEYSSYINTIFHNSKIKKILFHSSKNAFDVFDKKFFGTTSDVGAFGRGFYFSEFLEYSKGYGLNTKAVVLNIVNPMNILNTQEDDKLYLGKSIKETWGNDKDGVIFTVTNWKELADSGNHASIEDFQEIGLGKESGVMDAVVDEVEQIHILGTNKDIEKFKQYKNSYKNNKL